MMNARKVGVLYRSLCNLFKLSISCRRWRTSKYTREAGVQTCELEPSAKAEHCEKCGAVLAAAHRQKGLVKDSVRLGTHSLSRAPKEVRNEKQVRFNGRIHFDDGTSQLACAKREGKHEENIWIRVHYTLADLQELANLQLAQLRAECQATHPFLRKRQQ